MTPTEYQAQYINAPLQSFGFSERVVAFLADAAVTPRQCAEVVVALDFHPNEWEHMFCDLGLTIGQASVLRSMILEEVSRDWRNNMNTIDQIRDDVVVTALNDRGEEVTMYAWEEALLNLDIRDSD